MILREFNNLQISNLKREKNPQQFKLIDLPTLDQVLEEFIDFDVEYSYYGMSTEIIQQMKLREFLSFSDENAYVFQDVYENRVMFRIICRLLPPISTVGMRISRLYIGDKGTGSHIHNHSFAINYLIKGRKIWVLIPDTNENKKILNEKRMLYGMIRLDIKPLQWIEENRDELAKIKGVEFKIQEEGDVFTVPENYYHGVYNLTKVCGITYSWF